MHPEAGAIRTFLESHRKKISEAHRGGRPGSDTCLALTGMMDEAVQTSFRVLAPDLQSHVAILALGGYGRCEQAPHSDLDVMVLCTSGAARSEAREAAKSFLHLLWDAGVNLGHSVRTVDEALALQGTSLDSWTAMLESRFLAGNESLAESLYERIAERIQGGVNSWFSECVLAAIGNRVDRFGSSVKLLEPNIKKSAGGLRDLHSVFWLYRGNDVSYFIQPDNSRPASRAFLDILLERGQLEAEPHGRACEAIDFLFRVRHEMHYQRDSQHDTLEYALQGLVAGVLGFGAEAELRPVEVFMREYYTHTRVIHGLSQQLVQRFQGTLAKGEPHDGQMERVGRHLVIQDGLLSIDPLVVRFSNPADLFDAFVLAAERRLGLDHRLRSAVERSVNLLANEQTSSPELGARFRAILGSERVAASLRDMNDLGVLGRYIPEFGRLVAFFQHNVYHYYTADEHTLIALAKAEQLGSGQGLLPEVYRRLPRKEILHLAILLHDIAKPIGVADHEITGVEIARDVLERVGMSEMFPDVGFLIRHHLLMEQVAFRRNVHDPATIKEFAANFDRPEWLDYLFVLTYADLAAVNINVWTEWKFAILRELYHRTAEILRRQLSGVEIDAFHQEQRAEAIGKLVDSLSGTFPREVVNGHLQEMQSDGYVAVFTEEEIGRHIREAGRGLPISVLFSHVEAYTEVTVIARDAPFALSNCCAVLAANDADIFDANVFTRSDGIIIDRFRVSDAVTKRSLEPRVCEKIEEEMATVLRGDTDVQHLFEAHHRKWKRRARAPVNPMIRTDVEFEEKGDFTIIDVYAPDSVGFLYRVTETISRLELDICLAKIATRVDGIVDAFYVLDRSGRPVRDPERREVIRADILRTIKSMSEVVLTGEGGRG
jgi:[protein-PII] uridylyltransferase